MIVAAMPIHGAVSLPIGSATIFEMGICGTCFCICSLCNLLVMIRMFSGLNAGVIRSIAC